MISMFTVNFLSENSGDFVPTIRLSKIGGAQSESICMQGGACRLRPCSSYNPRGQKKHSMRFMTNIK